MSVAAVAVAPALKLFGHTAWTRDARVWLDRRNDWGERRARLGAGFGAVDCGSAEFSAPTSGPDPGLNAADGCVERNFREGQSLIVRFSGQCTDGCPEIRAWHPQSGLLKLTRQGFGVPRYSMENCSPACLKYKQGTDLQGNLLTRRTIGCC